jgi:hypothetical protein
MTQARSAAVFTATILFASNQAVMAAAGLATRDLNPVLQPIYLPALSPLSDHNGWRIDHSFFITNTLQQENKAGESLVIDVENYRYELGFTFHENRWLAQAKIPFIANQGGQLDGLIEDWHDFFGFPQGKRDDFPQDEIQIEYVRDGELVYSQTQSSNGLGDIALSLGYQPSPETVYHVGIELPTGSEADYTGNETLDLAFWISHEKQVDAEISAYGMFGISLPGDDGNLQGITVDHIWVAQLGLDYRFNDDLVGTAQFDLHTQSIDDSNLKAFDNSVQIQLGLGFRNLIDNHRLDLFFSEDILVGSAPDISFGLRLAQEF